jgi:anti-sigma-K factor RskA
MDIRDYIASGIIEQYVMGLCSDAEAAELEQLRNKYPELHHAIEQYEEELEQRMMQQTLLPGAAIDKKILDKFEEINIAAAPQATSIKKINFNRVFAAAAILLLFIGSYFIYTLTQKTKKLEAELQAAKKEIPATLPESDYAIMNNPSITPVAMYGVGSHSICRCTMYWDKRTGKIYIYIHHLPRSSETKDYQLWAMVDGKAVSVGIINDAVRGRFIELQNVPAGAIAFSVTLENAGGGNTPNSDIYLKGNI